MDQRTSIVSSRYARSPIGGAAISTGVIVSLCLFGTSRPCDDAATRLPASGSTRMDLPGSLCRDHSVASVALTTNARCHQDISALLLRSV